MSRELDRMRKRSAEHITQAKQQIDDRSQHLSHGLDQMIQEEQRVGEISRSAAVIIEDLDRDFKRATKLDGTDIAFLFLCTAFQCARQYLLPNDILRLENDQGDALIKGPLKKILPKSWADVLTAPVPYDTPHHVPGLDTGISGTTHRYRTLGHDPALGWIFGPANIMSSALTKSDIVTSYLVENQKATQLYPGSTVGMFQTAIAQVKSHPPMLLASLAQQAIHFGSDYFTKQSLPIPLLGTLAPEAAHRFMNSNFKNCPHIDMFSITRQAALAAFINQVIFDLHQLFYDESVDGRPSLYEVRTRKILTYSNVLATGSNIIYVAVSKDLKRLDVGGMLVTLHRLISDIKFINEVKRDFLKNELYSMVTGDQYDFMEGE